ncbi:hypothetical protein OPKNFCMD_6651 [Methylobacterium crusticola]|uniref:Uncharacterized protein n=1 Tax=Methylobacterium crusticola TaxID=1697972 RepID=A0ABQ4RAY7_9HYPH|nr:hypothetical protein OPKNFCMD_6651 [Methylobacterium crusticola]
MRFSLHPDTRMLVKDESTQFGKGCDVSVGTVLDHQLGASPKGQPRF